MAETQPDTRPWWQRFLLPRLRRGYAVRVVVVAVVAWVVFSQVCIPVRAAGRSMEPTYMDGSWNLCWRPAYWFSKPRVGDVVMVRFVGTKVMLLKRIVAAGGDTVAFRNGILYVNGAPRDEPYVQPGGHWELEERTVKPGHYYLVGDNRSMPLDQHIFGQTPGDRVVGRPLW